MLLFTYFTVWVIQDLNSKLIPYRKLFNSPNVLYIFFFHIKMNPTYESFTLNFYLYDITKIFVWK